jgi:hypothetical protein
LHALRLNTIDPLHREIQLVAAHDHCRVNKESKSKKETASHSIGCRKGYIKKVLKGGLKIKKAKQKGASQHYTGSPGQAVAPNIERRPRQTSEWVIFGVCGLSERTSSSGRPGIDDCGCSL